MDRFNEAVFMLSLNVADNLVFESILVATIVGAPNGSWICRLVIAASVAVRAILTLPTPSAVATTERRVSSSPLGSIPTPLVILPLTVNLPMPLSNRSPASAELTWLTSSASF